MLRKGPLERADLFTPLRRAMEEVPEIKAFLSLSEKNILAELLSLSGKGNLDARKILSSHQGWGKHSVEVKDHLKHHPYSPVTPVTPVTPVSPVHQLLSRSNAGDFLARGTLYHNLGNLGEYDKEVVEHLVSKKYPFDLRPLVKNGKVEMLATILRYVDWQFKDPQELAYFCSCYPLLFKRYYYEMKSSFHKRQATLPGPLFAYTDAEEHIKAAEFLTVGLQNLETCDYDTLLGRALTSAYTTGINFFRKTEDLELLHLFSRLQFPGADERLAQLQSLEYSQPLLLMQFRALPVSQTTAPAVEDAYVPVYQGLGFFG